MKEIHRLSLLLCCLLPAISQADGASGTAAGPEPQLELSEPVTVAMASPEVKGWGPYQFPGLERLPDGGIQLSFHVEADSAQAYGMPPARAVSADNGRTWRRLPREKADSGTAASWQSPPLRLPNGDLVWAQQQRPLKATDLKLPEKPFGQFISYGTRSTGIASRTFLPNAPMVGFSAGCPPEPRRRGKSERTCSSRAKCDA